MNPVGLSTRAMMWMDMGCAGLTVGKRNLLREENTHVLQNQQVF